jgi:hypothetical protein
VKSSSGFDISYVILIEFVFSRDLPSQEAFRVGM